MAGSVNSQCPQPTMPLSQQSW